MAAKLSKLMTSAEFDNGYWYATDLQDFASELNISHAKSLRKDELEKAIKHYLASGSILKSPSRSFKQVRLPDSELGLTMKRRIVNYKNDEVTKSFILRQAQKAERGFKIKSGTRYLLNRWREEQIAAGQPITYGDLVHKIISLAKTQRGPLRTEHGRYNNFISDFMAAKAGTRIKAVEAWNALKKLNCPKTFEAWQSSRGRKSP